MDADAIRQIVHLHQSGMAKRAIARKLALNVKTVRRILAQQGHGPQEASSPPEHPEGKLSPYLDIIAQKVEQDLTGIRILRELRELGYTGGRTILLDHIRKLRGSSKAANRFFCRFETAPAEEAQVDWSPYRVSIGGRTVSVHCFSMILCYSRYLFIQFHRDEKLPTLLAAHVDAFRFFGGVTRRIVYDNMTTVTLGRKRREVIWHPEFLPFAQHYLFEPFACRPKDPNRKGKVEAPFAYLFEDFLKGRAFDSWHHLDQAARQWLRNIANRRRHGTTQLIPEEAWMAERELLTALPEVPFPVYRQEARTLSEDGLIAVDGTRYSVPLCHVGNRRSVTVRIHPRSIDILNRQGQIVATHRKPDFPGGIILDKEHYQAIRRRPPAKQGEVECRFLARFPLAQVFLDGIKHRMKSLYGLHLVEIFTLARIYGDEPVAQAITHAARYRNFNAYAVARILKDRFPLVWPHEAEDLLRPATTRQPELNDVETGSFEEYRPYSQEEDEETQDPDATEDREERA